MKKVDNSIFDDEFQSNLDKLKTILRSRDLSFVDNNESKTVAMYLKKTLSTIQESIFFSSDITFNKKYEDLRDKLKEYGNKVQTMRNEEEHCNFLKQYSDFTGKKDDLPKDEGSLFHRIESWGLIKKEVDKYNLDNYEFYSESSEKQIIQHKKDLVDNNYIICSRLKNAQFFTSNLMLTDISSLNRIQSEFDDNKFEGKTFKVIKDGLKALAEYQKLDSSFKTPRMEEIANKFNDYRLEFTKIAIDLRDTGKISMSNYDNDFDIFNDTGINKSKPEQKISEKLKI